MKTDDLIRALASDPLHAPSAGRRMALLLPVALMGAGGALLGAIGLRSDLLAALLTPMTAVKYLLPLMLGGSALWLALRAAHPGQAVAARRLWAFAAVAAGVFVLRLAATAPADWGRGVMGHSAAFCVPAICLASLVPLGAMLMALRNGASPAPRRSGLLAGLAVGGFMTAIYALHCTEDDPLFFVTWYGLAILIVAGIGALAGQRLLRW
ncbi:MAG: DUF1109 domain-containing protein [Paracoccaceae bacterium]